MGGGAVKCSLSWTFEVHVVCLKKHSKHPRTCFVGGGGGVSRKTEKNCNQKCLFINNGY